jgi:ribose transport system substrate-binding protein
MLPRHARKPLWLAPLVAVLLGWGCREPGLGSGSGELPKPPDAPSEIHLAYVTNGIASFWNVATAGVKAAEREFGVRCDVVMPTEGVADQKRLIEDLVGRGIDGLAISPIDAANQIQLINEACEHTTVITQDCDAPGTNRLCYVGTDNYQAGRLAGQLVKEALPDGGSVIIFVGRLEQVNAQTRRQGVIDEIVGREPDPERRDKLGEPVRGDKHVVLDTRTDQFDFGKAKALAEDAIAKYPDLGCMVGLFAYNAPQCLAAVEQAGKVGQIKIVGFDEEEANLQGILDGKIYGTVVQNPYEYGRKSVEILAALVRGDKSVIPPGQYIDLPARQIRQENVKEFWDDLKIKMQAAKQP